jgi:hypothetical protein
MGVRADLRSGGERAVAHRRWARIVGSTSSQVVEMAETRERSHSQPVRRTRRFGQPEATAALRPSQRRAANNRAVHREQSSVEYWLRRLTRP